MTSLELVTITAYFFKLKNHLLKQVLTSGTSLSLQVKRNIMVISSVSYKSKKVRNFFRRFRTEILRISAFFLLSKTGIFVSRQKP